MAVFRRGKLVQFDHPDALLAHPRRRVRAGLRRPRQHAQAPAARKRRRCRPPYRQAAVPTWRCPRRSA
ncbi:hypothetical protein ACTMU2_25235 [Cupriavidus basilensis]